MNNEDLQDQIKRFSLPDLFRLRDVNRDRSAEWMRYTKHDWQEGLKEFTKYELIGVLR